MNGNSLEPFDASSAIEILSARLIELANSGDESVARAELAGWVQRLDFLAHIAPDKFPVKSLVAYTLAVLGKVTESFPIAVASLRLYGPDDLNVQVIRRGRSTVLESAFQLLHAARADLAVPNLKHLTEILNGHIDLPEERATLELVSYAEAVPARHQAEKPLEGRPSLIKLAIWGDDFIASAERNVLAACLADGNVPALKTFGTVILQLYARSKDVERLKGLDVVRELARHATVDISILPEELFLPEHMWGLAFWNRNILAVAEYDSLIRARQIGADLFCLGADMVLSDGCLRSAKETLMDGHDACLMTVLRVTAQKMHPLLNQNRQGPSLPLSADSLYHLSLGALHPTVFAQFMRQVPSRLPFDPYQFCFPAPGAFHVHGFQWHPLALCAASATGDIRFDYNTIDCRFTSDLLAGKDYTKACHVYRAPPGNAFMVGLDDESKVASFGNFEVSPEGVVNSLDHWIIRAEDLEFFTWLLGQRASYRLPPDLHLEFPKDCLDESDAIRTILALIEARRPQLAERVKFYTEHMKEPVMNDGDRQKER